MAAANQRWHLALAMAAPAVIAAALAAEPAVPACDCAGFCSGKCSLPTAASAPGDITVYRLTPRNITDLVNKDTGDAAGDAFFTLDEYDLPMRCADGVSTAARGCFLDVSDVYMQFRISVDGLYGPYGHCNPPHENSLAGNFSCRGMGQTHHGLPPQNSSSYCSCPRTDRAVGRQRVSMQFGQWGGFVGNLSRLLDGYWYSTPAAGQCTGAERPGLSGCSWRPAAVSAVVNASCVQRAVYRNIESRHTACFESCPGAAAAGPGAPPNRSTACVNRCFQQAVLGGGGAVAMTAEEITAPWYKAFGPPSAGGCPRCTLDPKTPKMYSCLVPAAAAAAAAASAAAAARWKRDRARQRPLLALQFAAVMRTADGYGRTGDGYGGDGCIAARQKLQAPAVVKSQIHWDGQQRRLAQTNEKLSTKVQKNTTVVDRFDLAPVISLELEVRRDALLLLQLLMLWLLPLVLLMLLRLQLLMMWLLLLVLLLLLLLLRLLLLVDT